MLWISYARAAEQADLPALGVGGEQVDDLDPGFEDLDLGRLFIEGRCVPVDRVPLLRGDLAHLVDRFADHVHDATQRFGADGDGDRAARVDRVHPPDQPFRGVHRDATDHVVAQVLCHLDG
jgi:hypothetical protein